jgi:hypothetical protein
LYSTGVDDLLSGLKYREGGEFVLVLPGSLEQRSLLAIPPLAAVKSTRRTVRASGGQKKKLNYAFLRPETVETKEECRPASAIREGWYFLAGVNCPLFSFSHRSVECVEKRFF